jgi:BirA family biotin operon repressor/biotin-[acetyl-CoA-carboxylase] ligase
MIWPAESIWLSLSALLPGITVEVLPEVDSSNSELMRRARAGQTDPVLLVAEHQTAGRGRLGRAWQGQAGQTLMFSLGLPLAPQDWSGLSLAVGLSLAHSLDPARQHGVHLKWPNDLWLPLADGHPTRWGKLAGVLIETAVTGPATPTARYTVIGVGLNVTRPEASDLTNEPAAWAEVVPQATAPEVLAQLAAPLLRDVLAFAQSGFAPLQNAFNARDALANTPVRLTDGREGVACGVDAQGALRVQTEAGVQTLHASEVSVRPAAA